MKFVTVRPLLVYLKFVLHRSGARRVWLDPEYADPAVAALLENPDGLFDLGGCEVVKDQRKIKVARVALDLDGRPQRLYVKRYNTFSLRHRLASLFTLSGGIKSLRGAAILKDRGIATAKPVAVVEERSWGAVNGSFFLSEEIEGGVTVDAYWRDTLSSVPARAGVWRRREFLTTLGALFHALHRQGVYHNDLKDANILAVAPTGSDRIDLFLLDLEGVRQHRSLSTNRRIKNLVQLNRTLGRYLSAVHKLRILRAYLDRDFANSSLRRKIVERVVRESNRLDAVKSRQQLCAPALLRS